MPTLDPVHLRLTRLSPASRFAVLVAGLVMTTACLADENFTPSQITVSVTNETGSVIYWTKAPADAAQPSTDPGVYEPIVHNETSPIPAGGTRLDDTGGCFDDEQLWLVRSRSGQLWDFGDELVPSDIEILQHFPPDTCAGPEGIKFTARG